VVNGRQSSCGCPARSLAERIFERENGLVTAGCLATIDWSSNTNPPASALRK
jgi:hypothetical protein